MKRYDLLNNWAPFLRPGEFKTSEIYVDDSKAKVAKKFSKKKGKRMKNFAAIEEMWKQLITCIAIRSKSTMKKNYQAHLEDTKLQKIVFFFLFCIRGDVTTSSFHFPINDRDSVNSSPFYLTFTSCSLVDTLMCSLEYHTS